MQRMRQGLSAVGPTPAERRVDEGGPAPDLAGAFVPLAEMLPGSGFGTGFEKGGTEGGIDVLAELLGIVGGIGGAVAGPPGVAIGYMGGKGAVKGLGSLLKKEVSKNLPKQKQGLKSVDIDEDLFKDVLKTSEGDPVVLYRGTLPQEDKKITESILEGKSREGYATFLSDNPSVAESYAGKEGVVTPFIVKPKKIIEYEDKYTRQNAIKPGSTIDFDKFEFDKQARNLKEGEVLVVKNVRDTGPRVIQSGPNDPKYWSYGSDVYAVKDENVLVSAISPSTKISKETASEKISIFPKPERMFPEGQRPKGGEYLNPKTGDVLTNKNVESASISITPEGKPKFDAVPVEKEIVGSPSAKGATQIKTNLFKKSAGWKWIDGPKKYKDIPTLVSVQNKGKHYYTLETNFPEGVNLTRYADSPSEPRLRPTVKGFVNLGKEIGKISVRGKEHPVYDKIINKYSGGQIKKGGSVVERNPNNYSPKAI